MDWNSPHRKHLAQWSLKLHTELFFKNYFQVSGRISKVRKICKRKKKESFFLHPLAPSCSSGIDIFLLEPWLIPTLTGQHGPVFGELKIQPYQRKLPSFVHSTRIYEDLLNSRHRRLNRAFCCEEDQPKRADAGIKGLECDGSSEGGGSFRGQGKFPGEMLPI